MPIFYQRSRTKAWAIFLHDFVDEMKANRFISRAFASNRISGAAMAN
jgi:hypothetical protein